MEWELIYSEIKTKKLKKKSKFRPTLKHTKVRTHTKQEEHTQNKAIYIYTYTHMYERWMREDGKSIKEVSGGLCVVVSGWIMEWKWKWWENMLMEN